MSVDCGPPVHTRVNKGNLGPKVNFLDATIEISRSEYLVNSCKKLHLRAVLAYCIQQYKPKSPNSGSIDWDTTHKGGEV